MKSHLACLRGPAAAPLAGLLALTLGGCATFPELSEVERPEPRHAAVNHAGDARLPREMRRVVLLPLHGGDLVPAETLAALDPVFATALQQQLRFEVVPAARAWCRRYFGAEDFSSAAALPHNFLPAVCREYGADAVLFVDLTTYRDFRPLAMGVRAKLASADGARLVWSYDETLSAADEAVANSARRHAKADNRADLPAGLGTSVLQSPARFAAYVADTAFGTLPPR